MATCKSTLSVVLPQAVPAAENQFANLPASYQAALSEGWYVTQEKTPFVHDKGEITMRNDEFSQAIRITYTHDGFGYQYFAPVIAE